MKIKKIVTAVTCVAFASLLLTGCGKKEEVKEETVFAVQAVKAVSGNMDDYLEFGGDVASVNEVNVMPDVAGKIVRINVSVGQTVEKNQILAYVDASRPGYDYSESPVKAPIAGRITAISPSIGTQVSQATPVAKISNTEELEIKVNVAERFVSRIKLNQNAVLTFDAYPGEQFEAHVSEVSPILDTTTRTMQIKIRITQRDNKIKVGMYARVKLITDTYKSVVIVPSAAVVKRNEKTIAFVVASEKTEESAATVKLVPVTVGHVVDDKSEITAGIEAGDTVVTKGQTSLSDGDKVNIFMNE